MNWACRNKARATVFTLMNSGGKHNVQNSRHTLSSFRAGNARCFSGILRANWNFHSHRPATVAGLRTTHLPRRWVHLDTRLLGLRPRRLLLGARYVGTCTSTRIPLDSAMVGME